MKSQNHLVVWHRFCAILVNALRYGGLICHRGGRARWVGAFQSISMGLRGLFRWADRSIPGEGAIVKELTRQLRQEFPPTHPAPPVLNDNPIDVAMAETRQAVDQRMVQTGGNFVCPAILLALAAVELDRLAELKQQVTAHSPASSLEMARNRAAMLGMGLRTLYRKLEQYAARPPRARSNRRGG